MGDQVVGELGGMGWVRACMCLRLKWQSSLAVLCLLASLAAGADEVAELKQTITGMQETMTGLRRTITDQEKTITGMRKQIAIKDSPVFAASEWQRNAAMTETQRPTATGEGRRLLGRKKKYLRGDKRCRSFGRLFRNSLIKSKCPKGKHLAVTQFGGHGYKDCGRCKSHTAPVNQCTWSKCYDADGKQGNTMVLHNNENSKNVVCTRLCLFGGHSTVTSKLKQMKNGKITWFAGAPRGEQFTGLPFPQGREVLQTPGLRQGEV